jgi:hypothetical protein
LPEIPLGKFLSATLLAVGIKAYLYAVAIANSVGAASITEALNWQTVAALVALAALGVAGHVVQRGWNAGIQEERVL